MLPIAGDDQSAKQTATDFLDSIGFDAFDVGPLAEGWRFQRDTAAYVRALRGFLAPTRPSSPASQVTPELLKEKLAARRALRRHVRIRACASTSPPR